MNPAIPTNYVLYMRIETWWHVMRPNNNLLGSMWQKRPGILCLTIARFKARRTAVADQCISELYAYTEIFER